MEKSMESNTIHFLFLAISFLLLSPISGATRNDGKTYVVLVNHTTTADDVYPLLSALIPSRSIIHTYKTIINGFACRLTPQELEELSTQEWFAGASPTKQYKLATTHTPAFLGLRPPSIVPLGVWNTTNLVEGTIIGIIDSGCTPDHPSFRDDHLPAPPAKWRGHCDFSPSTCNNKLIGARRILSATQGEHAHYPLTDKIGHGTHVSSIAAGAFVKGAGAYGSALGTASGMAPRAHLAIYQLACDEIGHCDGADVLKAMEYAVNDGVDVLSLSLGLS